MMFSVFTCVVAATTVFVSPKGDDAGDGSLVRPYATLERARDAVRELRTRNGGRLPDGGVVVELKDGIWRRQSPLSLDARDSGDESSPVVWRAGSRSSVVLSGEAELSWRPLGDGEAPLLPDAVRRFVRVAKVSGEIPGFTATATGPGVKLTVDVPISVFDAEGRLENARWPNDEYVVCDLKKRLPKADWKDGIVPFPSQRLASWAREPDVWVHGFWEYLWWDVVARMKKVDVAAGAFFVDRPFGERPRGRFPRFFVKNAFSELDRPGEWVVDRTNGLVYAWPRRGELAVAQSMGLLAVSNAANVVFSGIVFEKSRGEAVSFVNCTNVTLEASLVRQTSSWGVTVSSGSRCTVRGCDIEDVGEGGVSVEGGRVSPQVSAGHIVDNCHIHHYGQVIWNYRPGVKLSGVGNRVSHCLIHHSRHQGISFQGSDHVVDLNIVHDTCIDNDDSGAIYCYHESWADRGSAVEGNCVHMTGGQPLARMVFGIYIDAYSSDITVKDNIVNRAPAGGIFSSGGQGNTLVNNVVINCPMSLRRWNLGLQGGKNPYGVAAEGEKSHLFTKLRKRLEAPDGDAWRKAHPNVDRLLEVTKARGGQYAHGPLFFTCRDNALVGSCAPYISDLNFTAEYSTVTNNVEISGDSGFVDYFGMDWSLTPTSPIRGVIGGNTRFSEMGLYAAASRFSAPVKFGENVTRPRVIRPEYNIGKVRIDVDLLGKAPEGQTALARELVDCELTDGGGASAVRRLHASFGDAPLNEWKEYSFSFVPNFDCRANIMTFGEWEFSGKTMFSGIRVEGVPFEGNMFLSDRWRLRRSDAARLANCRDPLGVLKGPDAPLAPDGGYVAVSSLCSPMLCEIDLKEGVRVTISFKARQWLGD